MMRGISLTDTITVTPLQGLKGILVHCRIGRCPMLIVFCAYSAADLLTNIALKGQAYHTTGHRPAVEPETEGLHASGTVSRTSALKGQPYIKAGRRPAGRPIYSSLSKP